MRLLNRKRFAVPGQGFGVLGERIADGGDARERRGDAGLVRPLAFDREPLLVGGERLGKRRWKYSALAMFCSASPSSFLKPPRRATRRALVDRLRARVVLTGRGRAGETRQRGQELRPAQVGFAARSASRSSSVAASSRLGGEIGRRSFADQLPVVAVAFERERHAHRRRHDTAIRPTVGATVLVRRTSRAAAPGRPLIDDPRNVDLGETVVALVEDVLCLRPALRRRAFGLQSAR